MHDTFRSAAWVELCRCAHQEAKSFKQLISGELPPGWADVLPTFTPEDKGLATRLHSQTMLNALETSLPGVHPLSPSRLPSPAPCACRTAGVGWRCLLAMLLGMLVSVPAFSAVRSEEHPGLALSKAAADLALVQCAVRMHTYTHMHVPEQIIPLFFCLSDVNSEYEKSWLIERQVCLSACFLQHHPFGPQNNHDATLLVEFTAHVRSHCHLSACRAGFFGGSADLAPSNMTLLKAYGDFAKGQYAEKNIRFGVREHGMASIACGIALHSSGLIPYVATFFIFTGAAPCVSTSRLV